MITASIGADNLYNIVHMIGLRKASGMVSPFNIISCWNGVGSTSLFKKMIYDALDKELKKWMDMYVDFSFWWKGKIHK